MRPFALNDEEIWLITRLRSLTISQHEVIHFLVRTMSQNHPPLMALENNVVPIAPKSRQPANG